MKASLENIGIIMDGNRRWASRRGYPSAVGHKMGAKNLKNIVKHLKSLGIKEITVFGFSTENWGRSDEEVNALLKLFEWYLKGNIVELVNQDIRFKIIGDKTVFCKKLNDMISQAEKITKHNTGMKFNVALNYLSS